MLGTYFLWEKLGFPEPSIEEWHSLYRLVASPGQKGFYYFTKWVGERAPLINTLPSSSGDWKPKFVFIPAETSEGRVVPAAFGEARVRKQVKATGVGAEHIEEAFLVPEELRRFDVVKGSRVLYDMGKLKIKPSDEKVKALALAKSASPSSGTKRATEVSPVSSHPPSSKKLKSVVGPSEPSVAGLLPSSVIDVDASVPRKASKAPASSGSIKGLFCQYQLQELIAGLERRLKDATTELEKVREEKLDVEADKSALISEKDEARAVAGGFQKQLALALDGQAQAELARASLESRLMSAHTRLRELEARPSPPAFDLDLDSLMSSPAFGPYKELFYQEGAAAAVEAIKEKHPEWDLSFLDADEAEPVNDGKGPEADEEVPKGTPVAEKAVGEGAVGGAAEEEPAGENADSRP